MKTLKHVTLEEVLSLFTGSAHSKVSELSKLPTASALVVFENRDSASPEHQKRTVVAVGDDLTHKSVGELRGAWINEGQSKQEAVAFCTIHNHPPCQ